MPYAWVPVPEVTPRKYGLYSVADVRMASPHELQGIEHYSDNCNVDIAATPAGEVFCSGSPTRSTTHTTHPTVTRDVFFVYAYVQCAGIAEFNDAKNRAIEIFKNGEERAVEYKLMRLQADAGSGAVLLTPGVIPSLPQGVALLESYMDQEYAGVPTFGTTRAILSRASTTPNVTNRVGNHLETGLGSPIFGSVYYADAGPSNAAPGAGNSWLWTMGKVTVRLGPMFASEPLFIATAGANEVQTVSITGSPTGGTYTLTFDGQTTTPITYNSNAATVQAALVALSNVETGDITVTGTYPNFTLTFGAQYANRGVPQITATASLTGGTTPGVTTGTTTGGASMSTDNTYRVIVQRPVVVDWDCLAAATQVVIPA